jgi:hypothetical protein
MAAQPPDYLRTTANEIWNWHWIRVGLFTLAVVCAIIGFLRFYRNRIQQHA